MTSLLKKTWLHETPYALLALLVAFFLYMHTPNTDYDTPSYVNFYAMRPPIYSVFIWLFRWAGKYQFQLVMWAQSILTFISLLYARQWIKKNLMVNDFLIFPVLIFVLSTISLHSQMWYIQSEGLSFPFFIFTFFLLVECFQQYSLKKIIYLALWVGILMLTRLQFYYFYGIFILLVVWYAWKRVPIKSLGICVVILAGSILLTTLIDNTYHYFKHGFFSGEPASGVQFIIQPIFLANPDAADYFKNPTEKAMVQKIIGEVHKQKLNRDATLLTSLTPQYYEYAYQSYYRNYVAMQSIVYNTFREISARDQNRITNNISKILVLHEFRKNLYFYCWKVIDAMGGVPLFLFFCLLLFSVFAKILKNRLWKTNHSQLFVALTVIITFFNALLVSTAEPNCPPYFCYTQFLLYCLAALFADRIFFNESL